MNRKILAPIALALSLSLTAPILAQEDLTYGTPVEGEYAAEAVLYNLPVQRGDLVIASMQSEELDTMLTLLDGEKELTYDDDSGGDYNALLVFVAQEDKTYTLSAGTSWSDRENTGPYTLNVNVVDATMVAADETITLEPTEDTPALYAVFDGTAGQIIDITAKSAGDEDLYLTLIGTTTETIEYDDDDGEGNNPLLRRVVLPDTGLYLLMVENSRYNEIIQQAAELTVTETEQLYLSADAQELVLGNGEGFVGTEVYTVDMEAGKTYRFVLSIQPMPDESLGVNLELLDTDRFFDPELDTQHTTGVTWEYTATASGPVRLVVHPNLFANSLTSIQYTIALEVSE